jgi:lysozyme
MKASDKLLSVIRTFEGLNLSAYKCPAGVWTIGYGHTKGVKPGQMVTIARAEELLEEDLKVSEKYVDSLGLKLTQGQFDALVDFSFNLGSGKLAASTLLKKIRKGADAESIQSEFKKWVYSGSKVMPGLVRRREWEAYRWTAED